MADKLKCRYCGKDFTAGFQCQYSETKKHVALTDGKNCIWCGQKFTAGFHCTYSPTKIHQLDK